MPVAVGVALGAIFTIWNTLPAFGVHVNPLPTDSSAGIASLVAFVVGLFTKHPATPPTGSAEAVQKAQAEFAKAQAEKIKNTLPTG